MATEFTQRDRVYVSERLKELRKEEAVLVARRDELKAGPSDLDNDQKRQRIYVLERLRHLKAERAELRQYIGGAAP